MLALSDVLPRSRTTHRKTTLGLTSREQSPRVSSAELVTRAHIRVVRASVEHSTVARDPRAGRKLIARPMNIEQWADMDEDAPGEFYDGYVVEEEVPDLLHESVVAWLVFTLGCWGKPRQALVFASELKFAVAERRGRKPDVSMFAPGVRLKNANLVRVPPMLMVEVLTPTPRDIRRDRIDKLAEYAFFGVRSYWIVDPAQRSIACYELSKQGRVFLSATAATGHLEVPNFDGLVLDLDDLWRGLDLVEDDTDDEPTET